MSSNEIQPREVVIIDQPGIPLAFQPADWVKTIKIYLKGGDADGGENGYVIVELYDQ